MIYSGINNDILYANELYKKNGALFYVIRMREI